MDFHKQYRDMNENITPSDALVQQTIAKMESGRPHRARKPPLDWRLRRCSRRPVPPQPQG